MAATTYKNRIISPNRLPFLQAQILQEIYLSIHNQIELDIKKISTITDYQENSKILKDAINSLSFKKFIEGDFQKGFSIPSYRIDLYNFIIANNDCKNKNYSTNILNFQYTNKINDDNLLFDKIKTINDYNKEGVCHRWYDYLEDFPFTLIEEKINQYKINQKSLIVEPFAGSGTTNVISKMFNINSIGFDANPLMTFISKVKTTWDINLKQLKNNVIDVASQFLENINNIDQLDIDKDFLDKMPKKEINQWLSVGQQKEVILLKHIIKKVKNSKIKNLLLLAMSRSAIDASFVSFCPGTTFYPFREKEDFWNCFTNKIIDIYNDLQKLQSPQNSYGDVSLISDTCLNANKYIKPDSIDFLITSPPYPNDLELHQTNSTGNVYVGFCQKYGRGTKYKKENGKG